MSAVIPESRVVEIWRERLVGRTDLVTEEGEPVEIIYPGRPNDDRGADLRDAVIATDGVVVRGDVEVHVKSSGWWAHRHHQDPVYNRVVLHVVFTRDTETAVVLENGREIPTLALYRFTGEETQRFHKFTRVVGIRALPCGSTHCRYDAANIGVILDAAGDERFQMKAEEFRSELRRIEDSQLLYQGIMRALGYSRNKESMEELARRMPLRKLEESASGDITDAGRLARYQSLLLGTAGLLPLQGSRQCGGFEIDKIRLEKLEMLWAAYGEKATIMSADDWCFYKIRPVNLPGRRITAMSYLLFRYWREGLLKGLMQGFDEVPVDDGGRGLEKLFMAVEDRHHGIAQGTGLPVIIGKGRITDIVINVLLPYMVAWGSENSYPNPAEKALEMYRRYPRSARNTIERHLLKQLGINYRVVNTARRQQGLLHIYKTLCSQGNCGDCPLNSR